MLTYNVLSVIKAALRVVHGPKLVDHQISTYYLADEIAGIWRGMEVAIPTSRWNRTFALLEPHELAEQLISIAGHAELRRYQKHPRGPKKPPPKRRRSNPHVSTARILAKRER